LTAVFQKTRSLREIKPNHRAKQGLGSHAGAVDPFVALVEDLSEQIQILIFGVSNGHASGPMAPLAYLRSTSLARGRNATVSSASRSRSQ